ncbi:MAG: hypothetical protein HDR50_06705 [Desulfovibrio sp.]|uniref:hypothetical protein n=1 Tax=Desulfovibrio sp. TaxID=885 RepID=UPI001A68E8FE|nr:hypothetical protein [Desulfovibrio sp.]MBD5417338.1 hypothetical protein [Desulfovibrio sp.]
MPFPHTVPVLLRLTRRPAYWRVAVITPGRIRWRTYRREAYPDAEQVLRRCLAGLVQHQERHTQHQNHAENGGGEGHSVPPPGLPTPEADDAQRENRHSHAEVQERVRHPAPPAGRVQIQPRRLRVAWWGWLA